MEQFGWQKKNRQWGTGFVEFIKEDQSQAFLSVVFSWQMQAAFQRACFLKKQGMTVHAGGPAVKIQPNFLKDVANIEDIRFNALPLHNPNATFTSRGCIRKCNFCAVPKIEGDLIELSEWYPKPIVCDNNLLACSQKHFDKVIDSLKPLKGIDFNQGLDARLLTPGQAGRLAELHIHAVRLAWDHVKDEATFFKAVNLLFKAGIPKHKIRVYVLIGYKDTPDDALYRLNMIRSLGILPNPMRYQPLTSAKRNEFVGEHWTHRELVRFMCYFNNLKITGKIPFNEFDYSTYRKPIIQEGLAL